MNEMFNAFMPITLWCSAIILAVLLIRRLLAHKLAAKVFKLAWVCIAIRLVLPFDISLPTAPINIVIPPAIYVQSPAPVFNEQGNVVDTPLFDESITSPKALTAKMVFSLIKKALPAIWLIGALVFFAKEMVSYLFFMAHLRKSREAAQPSHQDLCGKVNVFVSPLISSPILCGYLRPAIYLPCKAYPEQERLSILQHEMTHYKQGDLWLQLLLLCTAALSWFNPIVHIMRRKAICDIEMTVDEKMLSDATIEQRIEYGQMLFAEISLREGLLLAQYNSGKGTKERFKAILSTATKGRGRLFLCAIISVCIGASLLVSCMPKPAPQNSSSSQPAISAPPISSSNASSSVSQSQSEAADEGVVGPATFTLPLGPDYIKVNCIHEINDDNFIYADIPAPSKTPIYAVADGEIAASGADNVRGNYVEIDHGGGWKTNYEHCDEIKIESGKVKKGDIIATVGNTGRSSGNHLHFGIGTGSKTMLDILSKWTFEKDLMPLLEDTIYQEKLSDEQKEFFTSLLEDVQSKIK